MTTAQKIIKYCALALALILVLAIVGGILRIAFLFIGSDDGDRAPESNGEMRVLLNESENLQIDEIDIEVYAVNLSIAYGDTLKVETDSGYISCDLVNGKLTVNESSRSWLPHASCAGTDTEAEGILNITLPYSSSVKSVELESGAGMINIKDLTAENINFEFGAGEAVLSKIKAKTADIQCGVGKVTVFSSEIDELSLEAGVGEVKLEAALGDSTVDCGVGKVELLLLGDAENYKLDVSRGIGSVDVNGLKKDGDVYGSGRNVVKINGGIGSIFVFVG